jgi:sugar-specific transcriptional regulator TrmB
MLRDEGSVIEQLQKEVGLGRDEAILYLKILKGGQIPRSKKKDVDFLLDRGMVILSGDNKWYIPIHPRLAIANSYRTWRERVVREINEKRMRVDKLIIELIPVYEATTEKKLAGKSRG